MSQLAELAAIRRHNLQCWLSAKDITPKEFSEKLQKGRSYVSLIFKAYRPFGEKAARYIESKLNMPTLYLDSDGMQLEVISGWATLSDIGSDLSGLVPRVDLQLVQTDGVWALSQKKRSLPPLAFSRDLMQRQGVNRAKDLIFFVLKGQSMSPRINNEDLLMIDMGQKNIDEEHMYLIRFADELRVRRLSRRVDGGLIIRADNSAFPETSLGAEDAAGVKILGRVLWRSGAL
jgi:hypothetical protein